VVSSLVSYSRLCRGPGLHSTGVLTDVLDFGVELGWPLPYPIPFLWVFLISALPTLAVRVLDGLARLPNHPGWSIPLRLFATLLVIVLGAGIAILGPSLSQATSESFMRSTSTLGPTQAGCTTWKLRSSSHGSQQD
jgi:hypothetical protein